MIKEEKELLENNVRELIQDVDNLDADSLKMGPKYMRLIEFAREQLVSVPEKKVAPKVFVPSWYYDWVTDKEEEGFDIGDTVSSLWSNLYRGPFAYSEGKKDWLLENKALASRAILDGCLEELFLVVLPGTDSDNSFLTLENGKISYIDRVDYYHDRSESKQIFTEKEIVAIDKRLMIFSDPLELDEEGNPL